jgi:hypothetical protein
VIAGRENRRITDAVHDRYWRLAIPRTRIIPKNCWRTTVAEPIWENASETALYRGSGRLFRPRSGRLERTCRETGRASLAWPVVTVAIVNWFRPEVRAILSRIRKGKFLGTEFELDELQAKTVAAEEKADQPPISGSLSTTMGDFHLDGTATVAADRAQDAIEEVLREAGRSPRLGLMLLSSKIERAARELAADTGLDVSRRSVPLNTMIRALVQAEQIPGEEAEALNLFNQVRNRIVHGHDADDDEVARAIDSGTRLLRLLLSRQQPISPDHAPD